MRMPDTVAVNAAIGDDPRTLMRSESELKAMRQSIAVRRPVALSA
jgi:hypothetical protein